MSAHGLRTEYSIFTWLMAVSLFTVILWAAYRLLHNAFFHPLRQYPGPFLARLTGLPFIYQSIRGHGVSWIVRLHAHYGEVVRVAPNELSYSGAGAIKEIYGHRLSNLPSFDKDPNFYMQPGENVQHIANSIGAVHQRQRRVFANAFSNNALRKQEQIFQEHCDKLVDALRAKLGRTSSCICDLVRLYNFTTFDIMGDLTFGESLGMQEQGSYHPWVAAIFAGFRYGTYLHAIRRIPLAEKILVAAIPRSIKEKQRLHQHFSEQSVDRRLKKDLTRPDIWGIVLSKGGNSGLTVEEMYANANMFMIGGTETTATLLSGLTYYLLKNKRTMNRLSFEIRNTFANDQDITMERLARLPYLNACIEEGLRMYPPISNGLPRIVPRGGATIQSKEVPCDTDIILRLSSMPPIWLCIAIPGTSSIRVLSYLNGGCRTRPISLLTVRKLFTLSQRVHELVLEKGTTICCRFDP
ncbi:cytochrome P450 [Aureobasidium sp. EXF-10727]|nr:cytochrome P450 [Aureobasidium sp. EXF-10727]